MDGFIVFLALAVIWRVLSMSYQKAHISLLAKHLADYQLEQHMETLTQGYTRAIQSDSEARQLQVLETFAQTERAVASQAQAVASSFEQESTLASRIGIWSVCIPYAERVLPSITRDFRKLLHIHAKGIRYVVNNEAGWDAKERAYHLSAELYLLQHSCHWFCKSRGIANARLQIRHKVQHQKVLDSVSSVTRSAYLRWLQDKS